MESVLGDLCIHVGNNGDWRQEGRRKYACLCVHWHVYVEGLAVKSIGHLLFTLLVLGQPLANSSLDYCWGSC